jgi:hypothetical protein
VVRHHCFCHARNAEAARPIWVDRLGVEYPTGLHPPRDLTDPLKQKRRGTTHRPLLDKLNGRLSLPAIGAPRFIISVPDLVVAQCTPGIIGAMPALNARPAPNQMNWGSDGKKGWKDVWGSGQGIGAVKAVVPAAELLARLKWEYHDAQMRVRTGCPLLSPVPDRIAEPG